MAGFRPSEVVNSWVANETQSLDVVLENASVHRQRLSRRMTWLQEELDWHVYSLFGLLDDSLKPLDESNCEQGLLPGHRPFEYVLAEGNRTTQWFDRNGYSRPPNAPASEPGSPLEARANAIRSARNLRVIEQPEFKHRWTFVDWNKETELAARDVLMSHTERSFLGSVHPMNLAQLSHSTTQSLGAKLEELLSVFASESNVKDAVADGVGAQSVPFLRCHRLTATGLEKRADWQSTWDLQRREDAGEDVGDIPVPPKYAQSDFRDPIYWRLRGKLDVPKERFISYPGCESDEDNEPVYGWAGWDHLQQAQALAALYQDRKDREGWTADRLTPMLAGLLELLPWLLQWHNEPSDEFDGLQLGDYFQSYLDEQCRELGLTLDDLRDWRPEAKGRGRKKA